MLYWLTVIILAYLFFGLGSFGDKLVLAGKPKQNVSAFYVGVFGLVTALCIIPFIKLGVPNGPMFALLALDALARILGIYSMFVALESFEVSRVLPMIGAVQPIFILILTWIFWGSQAMTTADILAFLMLFAASIIISIEKNPKITGRFLKITLFSSLMFSLDYVFLKLIFSSQPFWQGIVWIQLFIFIIVLAFLFSKKSRKEILARRLVADKKNQALFICAQVTGGIGNLLQSFAISLTPVVFLATINALRGVQYAFLFIITLFVSFLFPKVLREEISKRAIFQKTISIIMIIIGLYILMA